MRDPKICVVDYGMGNLSSVAFALASLGCVVRVSEGPNDIEKADALILPGVGAFAEAMQRMKSMDLIEILTKRVLKAGVPFLGICLGMQLIGRSSTEGGLHGGLGWIDADIDFIPEGSSIRVPHIGWNEVRWSGEGPWNTNIEDGSHYYFNHSYCMKEGIDCVVAKADIGLPLVAAVVKDNIWGVQFHPEKSQNNGRRLLRNFLNYVAAN